MSRDPSLPPEPLVLTEASAQEIQLELIRRWKFNCFDGEKVVASLRRHRGLWRAALMDRLGVRSSDILPAMHLIKLRDLPKNEWNVDTLVVLTPDLESARVLAKISEDENWIADDARVIEDESERSSALGTSHPDYIVSFWWD